MYTRKTPILNRRLGRRLKALRTHAGLSLEDAAAKLDKTRSSLNRIETGVTRADVHLVRSMFDVYDVYQEDLFDLVRAAWKPRWASSNGMGYVDAETEAVTVHEFSGLSVTGLLQTEAYIRALFTHDSLLRTGQELEREVASRLNRQRRLTSEDNPLKLVAIVDEAALWRAVGGPAAMRQQLCHLIEAAALPTVTLQVLPLSGGSHSAMNGAFTLLAFPMPDIPELLYVSHVADALHIEKKAQVHAARAAFENLRTQALSPVESVALIERLANKLYGS